MAASLPPSPICLGQALPGVAARRHRLHFTTKSCTNSLKLRTNVRINAQTRFELGADLSLDLAGGGSISGSSAASLGHLPTLEVRSMAPWAALMFQLDAHDRGLGCVKLDTSKLCLSRRVHVGRRGAWWDVPLDLCLGFKLSDGKLLWGVQPAKWPVTVALGAAMLAAGMPVHVHKTEVGALGLQLPFGTGGSKQAHHMLQERVEVDACIRRQGRCLQVDLRQLNGVVRLREA